MLTRSLSGLLFVLCAASLAGAAPITFETTPGGGAPIDDSVLVGSYVVGLTTVTFGIDSNNDFLLDTDVFFERRGRNGLDAYTSNFGSGKDEDASATGGSFFLRPPESSTFPGFATLDPGEAFLIVYSGVLPTSASGSIWDIDGNEGNTVQALDAGMSVLDTVILTPAEGGDSLPATFSFANLASPISFIRIVNNNGPLGFDNFDATRPAGQPVPEPASIAIWSLLGLAANEWRRRRRFTAPS